MPRPKGSRNRRTAELSERMEQLGCDPAESLVRIAKLAEEAGELGLAIDCYKSLMPYLHAKLKASDVRLSSGNMEDSVVINFQPPQTGETPS